MIQTCVVITLAAASAACTVAKASVFLRLRMLVMRNTYWGGRLVSCPYCLSHWTVIGLAAIYRPALIHFVPVVDVVVTTFAMICAATVLASWVCSLWWAE